MDKSFIQTLKRGLQQKLPGFKAQKMMMPEGRSSQPGPGKLQQASVLIALYQQDEIWYFPLIKRSIDGYTHSGQIGLPGGRQEKGETAIETALREAEEEVGLTMEKVTPVGALSPLPIPISSYIVQPIVGVVSGEPVWDINPDEVDALFRVSLNDLLDDSNRKSEIRVYHGQSYNIPYYDLTGRKIWGATAMILSEFRYILKRL